MSRGKGGGIARLVRRTLDSAESNVHSTVIELNTLSAMLVWIVTGKYITIANYRRYSRIIIFSSPMAQVSHRKITSR